MIALWLLYAAAVAVLAGGAALAFEQALRTRRWPARWVWAGAMVLSVAIPSAALLAPSPEPEGVTVDATAVALPAAEGAFSAVPAAAPSWVRRLDLPLAWAMVAAGAAGLLWLAASAISLRARMRRWPPDEIDGVQVLVSEDVGPAVVGVLRSMIVLPRWALAIPAEARRLMLAHETEHRRARDPLLLLGGLVLATLFLWNLPLWWQLRRLRLAVEVDCDARVLDGFPDVRSYAALLLDVSRHGTRRITAAAALSEPLFFLERRIRIMTAKNKTVSPLRLLGFAALAGLLVAGACELTEPPTPQPWTPSAGRDGAGPEASPAGDVGAKPTFTPYEVQPEIRNRSEFVTALEQNYPVPLRDAGIGGTVRLWVFIDESGTVANTQVVGPSEHPMLDEAALASVRVLKFSPAMNRDERVPVWIQFPVTFVSPEGPGGGGPAEVSSGS